MIGKKKVVTSEEMSRIEKLSIAAGSSEADFMEKAGLGVADAVAEFLTHHSKEKHITVFAGKGNNGGDAYVAAVHLKQKGYEVEVVQLYGYNECSPLCKVQSDRFQKNGGKIHPIQNHADIKFPLTGVIIDGLVGTGFKGSAADLLAEIIEKINVSGLPVFSIDIPSGLCGSTGKVGSVAVKATYTIYLELPKLGFFIEQGWDYVGKLLCVSFGLPKAYIEKAEPSAFLASEESMVDLLPQVKRTRHKYEAGYVLAIAGSESMPGAAILSCNATLHTGAGIVRLFHPEGMEEVLSCAPPEIIKEAWDLKDMQRVLEEMTRARSVLIGPGMGREKGIKKTFKDLLEKITIPAVLDADALHFIAQNPSWALPSISVLTPHKGEMQELLSTFDSKSSKEDFLGSCVLYAEKRHVVLVLKGAPTIVFFSHKLPLIIPYGDPGMATAGSGDVLTGVIAALLAQKVHAYEAAVLGVYLHAKAGEYASKAKTPYCMIASDITDNLPKAFKALLQRKRVGKE